MRHYSVCIPNNMASERKFEDLDLTKDEVKRLGEALKDENFRKMLVEYAEEISDPENRRKAEEEIAMMEGERGMSVQFIHPQPGYVIKTTVDGSKKGFINICQNEKIEKPKANKQAGPDGKSGFMWHIPHSFAPPRDDHDKAKLTCTVFDVVFHPDTYRMAMSNVRFKKLVEDTAVEGIEHQFNVSLDKKNMKYPKMKFKGVPTATVIRERLPGADTKTVESDNILNNMPYPYDNKTSAEKAKENEQRHTKKNVSKIPNGNVKSEESKSITPKYTITHRSELDMSEYRNSPDARTSTRPNELVVKIELPLLKSAAQASLDIFENRLVLESVSPAAYKLDLSLPFPVNEDEGSAKFDKSKKTLTVTLPVLSCTTPPLPFTQRKDSDEIQSNAPVIEVISNKTNAVGNSVSIEPSSQDKLDVTATHEGSASEQKETQGTKKMTFPQNVKWNLPEFQFSQDNETVSFVINVQNVEENAVEMFFPQSTTAVVQFMSIGSGCFPVYYSLYVEFPDGCDVSSEHCNVDVSNDNLVFVILKNKKCRGLWDSFNIGIDDAHLETKKFLTESNLQKDLSELAREAAEEVNMPMVEETTPVLSVVEMNEKKLTIDIKPSKNKKMRTGTKTEEDDDSEEYDQPSSAEIEVVHKHPPPELHSILKQRTVSESSEDFSNMDPESPRSEGEELSSSFGKKRSVSFSNHIDRASFKSSASVSSMTPALKSKRRRQRKRDAKVKGRTRHSSEGTSSGEESLHAASDSYSYSEGEEASEKSVNEGRGTLERCFSDPGPQGHSLFTICDVDDEKERGAGEPGKKAKGKGSKSRKTKAKASKAAADCNVIAHTEDVLDFRTKNEDQVSACGEHVQEIYRDQEDKGETNESSACDGKEDQDLGQASNAKKGETESTAIDKNKKIISEIKSKLAEGSDMNDQERRGEDSDDDADDFVDAVSTVTEDFKVKVGFDKSSINTSDQPTSSSECNDEAPDKKMVEVIENDASSKGGNEKSSSSTISAKSESSVRSEGDSSQKKSEVETVLSWDDKQVNGGEHVTQCAFEFSNSVMYDLDLD